MKKGLIAVVVAAVVAVGGAGGYMMYQQKQEEKAYEQDMAKAIANLPDIEVYEKEELPSIETEFAGTEKVINISSVKPDISSVHTSEPGEYEVKYTFNDTKGNQRIATVKCNVKPELSSHVNGMSNIEIDEGEELPTEANCTFDEYINSVTLNTENVDNEEAGTYDISYTILGTNGDMKNVEGYSCTVNEVTKPTPEPTKPPKKKKPVEKPKETTDEKKTEDKDTAVGNIDVQETVVETGDENNIMAIVILIAGCVAAAIGVVVYKKKKQ